jgi:HSP20 family protein
MNGELQTTPIRFIPVESEDPDNLASNAIQWQIRMKPHIWRPPTDLIETSDRLVIRVEIAGMNEQDFSIRIDQKRVIINGYRSEIHEERCFHRMEIPFGYFETEVDLPQPILLDQATAAYQDGFLSVFLPKSLPKNIPISTNSTE